MSKSITITLPNDIADTLDRRMGEIEDNAIPGTQTSKSAYVSAAVKMQLIKEGCKIFADDPKPPRRKKKNAKAATTKTAVAGAADFSLDETESGKAGEPAAPSQ